MNKVKVIAEIGWNWMGDINLAKKMIKAASDNGATYVKTQVFNESFLKPGPWDTDGRREIYKKAQVTLEQLREMKKYCEENNIGFMASCMSVRDCKLYNKVTSKIIKIPGFESRNINMLKYAFDNFDKIIMSTGTSSVSEIKESLKNIGHKKLQKIVLLHCVSSYPCTPENANLPRITKLLNLLYDLMIFNPEVGYSDHIIGVESAKISLQFGRVNWIEKHFTIDRTLPGRDNKFAILPEELKNLTDYIKTREEMNKDLGEDYLKCEQAVRDVQPGRFAIDEIEESK